MSKEKINEQVNKQVRFKMEELKTSLLNHSNWDMAKAFNPELSISEIKEFSASSIIKKVLAEIVDKEIRMSVPDLEEKDIRKIREIKDKKIEEFFKIFGHCFRGRHPQGDRPALNWLVNNL